MILFFLILIIITKLNISVNNLMNLSNKNNRSLSIFSIDRSDGGSGGVYMGITASIRKPPLFFCPYFLRLSITFIIFVTFFLNISFEYDHFRTRTSRHGLNINRIMYPHMIFFYFFELIN